MYRLKQNFNKNVNYQLIYQQNNNQLSKIQLFQNKFRYLFKKKNNCVITFLTKNKNLITNKNILT